MWEKNGSLVRSNLNFGYCSAKLREVALPRKWLHKTEFKTTHFATTPGINVICSALKLFSLICQLYIKHPTRYQSTFWCLCKDIRYMLFFFELQELDIWECNQKLAISAKMWKKIYLHKPDSTSPNPDCIVNIIKALVKIHVASSEFSCAASSDSTVTFPAFDEFCVTFIFNLKNSTFSEVHFSRICIIHCWGLKTTPAGICSDKQREPWKNNIWQRRL